MAGRPDNVVSPTPWPTAAAKVARTRLAWRPVWSRPAAMRTLRAVLVIPSLFALTYEGLGNLQIALFAAFGGFASLIVASFAGSRRDKIVAHLGLAVTGSIVLVIGTAVSGIEWLAVLITIPVAFAIFFAGVAGPNTASGVNAALFGYLLPVAAGGTVSMIPDRLAGWWLASVVATVAVLLLSPPPGDRLRAAAGGLARELAAHLETSTTTADRDALLTARNELTSAFARAPYRPTGLATADQGLASVIQLLGWCTTLIADATDGHLALDRAPLCDRELFAAIAAVLGQTGDLLVGPDGTTALPDVGEMERRREASVACHRSLDPSGDYDSVEVTARRAIDAHIISIAVGAMVGDALIATRRADPETIAARRRYWYGAQPQEATAGRRAAALSGVLSGAIRVMARHASLRSVRFRNSVRGALALAAAVLVADQTGVQHGLWVMLGALSALRTNAASTGSTALRALAGTVIGFAAGALLLLGLGTSTPVLWAALPIAVAVAAYSSGTLPFTVGQAAFTVVVVVLFNLLQPVGWKLGLLRVQDVAMGCAVSLVVGVLFWPRGASSVVGDDLADAFRRGAAYLTQTVDWVLGARRDPPDTAAAAVTAGIRLDEALRSYLVEQGTKRVSKEDLWTLVVATMQLRLTATSLASLQTLEPARHHHPGLARARAAMEHDRADLADFYERVAALVGRPAPREPASQETVLPVSVPALAGLDGNSGARVVTAPLPRLLWVDECLQHLSSHARAVTDPALHMAEQRRLPWWR
jgi:Fusaric acid resistance protein-like